jgi:hypothetical protein
VQTASIAPAVAAPAAPRPAALAVAQAPQPKQPLDRIAVFQTTKLPRTMLSPEPIGRPYALAAAPAPARLPGTVAKLRPVALIPEEGEPADQPLSLLPPASVPEQ